jgi:hypothetical protein
MAVKTSKPRRCYSKLVPEWASFSSEILSLISNVDKKLLIDQTLEPRAFMPQCSDPHHLLHLPAVCDFERCETIRESPSFRQTP